MLDYSSLSVHTPLLVAGFDRQSGRQGAMILSDLDATKLEHNPIWLLLNRSKRHTNQTVDFAILSHFLDFYTFLDY